MRKKLLLILIGLSAVSFNVQADDIANNSSHALVSLPDFSPIYEKVGKSVVNITVTQIVQQQQQQVSPSNDPMFDYFYRRTPQGQAPRQYKAHGLGTGFIISEDGYILTNAHVVANSEQITVKTNDKREFKAKVIGIDRDTDVAVLKIDAKGLSPVKIGDPNKMKPGNWVLAIGAPFGLENTITQGIISALSRDLPDDSYIPFLQTDVPINPGNSGGPLINLDGEVIGINSQIYSKSGGYMGISFSIPIDYAMRVEEQLRTTGKVTRGRLGIAIQPLTDDLARSFGLKSRTQGVLVNSVEPGSGAANAGVQAGDVILKANGKDIDQSTQLPRIVGQLGPNKTIDLEVWRNGKKLNLVAKTTLAVEQNTQLAAVRQEDKTKVIKKLGIIATEVNPAQLPKGIKYGLVVNDMSDNTQFAGVMPGDLIVGVGNKNLTNYNDFMSIVNQVRPGKALALKIVRSDGQQLFSLFVPITVAAQ